MIGHTISHYTITDKLGQGGMGEVYRARDTKLNREVALKILPPAFARDAERMARFEREAQVLASLNHPHIAQIHGLEEADGTTALVLELVEGETLAERIARGPIPVDHALKIAVQICEGLEAAHEKRIIHRDLKPANIKITPDEQVKILDFGLAKALEGEISDFDLANSPTLTHDGTRAGVILGTAGYMAPEQARGKPASARADIWAFGVVLYEMLTGQRVFAGETVSDTLAKVLEREPDWDAVPTSVPPHIRRLIRRCLTKDHRERLHDIGDARLELQETLPEGEEETGAASEASRRSSSRVLLLTGAAAAGLAMGVLGAWGLWGRGAPVVPATVDHVELVTAEPTAAAILGKELAISPDGRRVVYRSLEEPRLLYLRDLSQREPTRIGEARVDEANPFFSPDGQWFGFFDRGNLKKVAVAGGTPEVLCEAPNPFGGTWGRDGTIVFAPHVNRGLWMVSENGGEPERLTTRKKNEWGHLLPVSLEDGRSVLFAIWYGSTRYDLALLDLASKKYEVILEGVSYAVPTTSGHLVFARSDGLYAVAFDPVSKRPQGREVPLLRDVFVSHHGPWGQFDLSRTGTLVYRTGRPRPSELVQVDLAGTVAPLPLPAKLYHRPRYAPDGQTIAVNVWEDGDSRTYLADLESGRLSHVASQGSADPPLWTPDGRHLIVSSDRLKKGQWESFQQPISGGEAAPFLEAGTLGVAWFWPVSWARDGSVVVGGGRRTRPAEGAEVSGDLMYWAKEDPSELKTLVAGRERAEMYNASLSPDGKWVVYVVNEWFYGGLPSQILITDFPEGKRKYPISQEWGYMPLWAPDGKHIYFVAEPGLMVVDFQWEPTVRVSAPRRLFSLEKLDPGWDYYPFPGYDISPDGKHLLMTRLVSDWQHPRHLNLITNLFSVLREKVPTAN